MCIFPWWRSPCGNQWIEIDSSLLIVASLGIISEIDLEFECAKKKINRSIEMKFIGCIITGFHMEILHSYECLCIGL